MRTKKLNRLERNENKKNKKRSQKKEEKQLCRNERKLLQKMIFRLEIPQ